MENQQEVIGKIEEGMVNTYPRYQIVIKEAQGSLLFDIYGNSIIDFLSNFGACLVGHCDPEITEAIRGRIDALSNVLYHTEQVFAKEMANFFGYDMILPMNTGGEAVGKAMKIARKTAYTQMGIPRNKAKILFSEGNFHGRCLDVLSASTDPHYTRDFGPYLPGIIKIPFGNPEALRQVLKKDKNVCAFITEVIQVEGGVTMLPPGYLKEYQEICGEEGVLFILDEVQTGCGRTGKKLCQDHENVRADLTIIGKAIGGGLYPVSAILGDRGIIDVMESGEDGSTWAGNPMAYAVARTVLRICKKRRLEQKAEETGKYILENLGEIESPHIKEVRGKGLLGGIELKPGAGGARKFCDELLKKGRENRVLLYPAHENVIRLEPALNIPIALVDSAIEEIKKVLKF